MQLCSINWKVLVVPVDSPSLSDPHQNKIQFYFFSSYFEVEETTVKNWQCYFPVVNCWLWHLLQIIDIHQHCLYKTLRTGHTSVSFFLGWKNSPVWLTFTTCTVCMYVGIGYNKFSSSASFISVKIFSYLFLLFQMSYVLLYCETFLLLLSL